MIIYAKIRRSIDYTDFILLNVHPAELFFLERGEKRRFMALRTGGVDQFLGRLFGRRYYKKTAATNSILVNYGSVPAERTRLLPLFLHFSLCCEQHLTDTIICDISLYAIALWDVPHKWLE